MPAMITSRVDRLHPRRQRERLSQRPGVDLALGRRRDQLRVALDRLAVEGRQQQLALAQVARAGRGQDRVGTDDRPQRRLAGQRGVQLRARGEQRADMVGMAGDHRAAGDRAAHPEDLAELATGAEDELDLTLAEAQGLGQARQRDPGRPRQLGQLAGLDRPGRRGRCGPGELVGGKGLGGGRGGRHRRMLHGSM
jgi:hypothetical protein